MNLYDISTQYLATANQLADMDIDEQTMRDTLDAEAWPVEEKVRAVSAVILNLQAEADMVKATADKIMKLYKAKQSRADALHNYLLVNMQRTGNP